MPMRHMEEYGTLLDGSKSTEYCHYCYKDGQFTYDCTMDEMIELCIPPVMEQNPDMTKEQAQAMMKSFMPALKRWQQA